MSASSRWIAAFLKRYLISTLAVGMLALPAAAQGPPPPEPPSAGSPQGDDYVPAPPPDEAPPPPDYTPPPPPSDTTGPGAPPPAPGGAGDVGVTNAPPPPPPDYDAPDQAPPDYGQAPPPPNAAESEAAPLPAPGRTPLQPGEAYHTRFSGTVELPGPSGPVTVIDLQGVVGSIVDLRNPGMPPSGQHWIDEPQRSPATAVDTGQVFGITFDDSSDPNIFVTATSAFGLHLAPGTTDWMQGMWGPDGGPGTVYRLSPETGYLPEFFADVALDGRRNTGPALGNIAYDRWNRQLFVSDLETGMIHRLSGDTGADLGNYDHGLRGRTSFIDGWTGEELSLPPVAFDPASAARIDGCAAGPFERHPECWNYADFRRRVWGLAVRQDEDRNETRLYYAVWGSDAFGNPEWADAGEDRRNSIWSVGIARDGSFDTSSIRREFFLPSFFPADPALGPLVGNSRPVSDIEFADCGPQRVMLVAERGGVRNLGLDKENPFANPHESRVLRYELGSDGIWRPAGRDDVGFYERQNHGLPRLRASGAGGCDFGYGYRDDNSIDLSLPNAFVWMTGDNLCSPAGACNNPSTGAFNDTSWVDGMQGTPDDLAKDVMPEAAMSPPPAGPATPPDGPSTSYMIDSDINVDPSGNLLDIGIDRNQATLIGDIDIFERCAGTDYGLPPPPDIGPPPPPPPVHLRDMTHMRNASPMHAVDRSWHERNWSWHSRERSWHHRNRSWHNRDRSWHWRTSSWHWLDRSWHSRERSWHWKERSWHWRDSSWHRKRQSWHWRVKSWHGVNRSWHDRALSWHWKDRSWHSRDRSWHWKNRSLHWKSTSWHFLDRSWHSKENSWHDRQRSWHWKNSSFHEKPRSWHNRNRSWHERERSWHDRNRSWHDRKRSLDQQHNRNRSLEQQHNRNRSLEQQHNRNRSLEQQHNRNKSLEQQHNRNKSLEQQHNRNRSLEQQHNRNKSLEQQHNRNKSLEQQHNRNRSLQQQHNRNKSLEQQHNKNRSLEQQHNKNRSLEQQHNKNRSLEQQHNKNRSLEQQHNKNRSLEQQHNRNKSLEQQHNKNRSLEQQHNKNRSLEQQHNKNRSLEQQHNKNRSLEQQHNKNKSLEQQHNKNRSLEQQHNKNRSLEQQHNRNKSLEQQHNRKRSLEEQQKEEAQ